MPFFSQNPSTEEVLGSFEELSNFEIQQKLLLADLACEAWRLTLVEDRGALLKKAGAVLRDRKRTLGELAAKEMGKPITSALAEVEKCAAVCEYYAENAAKMLVDEKLTSDASESYVRFDPLGVVLAIMPWNYPFWQVFRCVAPALAAGNACILKHSSNVPQCAAAIEGVFRDAGFPDGVFQNVYVRSDRIEQIIVDPAVRAVALTGSTPAGSDVASQCGREIKKTVLELGGSDPFIVLADADVVKAAAAGAQSRLQNAGQSCIAAKRFIVVKEVVERFTAELKKNFASMKVGDPMDEKTVIGPLATSAIRADLDVQVKKSIAMGAVAVMGGDMRKGKGFYYEPTILVGLKKGMPVCDEETFGPVAAIIVVENAEEAIATANDTEFGLGASLWTSDIAFAKSVSARINSGSVFINGMVKSDQRLPFGGIGKSGYGRELSHYGIKEFVNVKTVWIA